LPGERCARLLDVAAAGSYIGLSELAKSSAAERAAAAREISREQGESRWD
jgi:hypothetical protein